MRNLLARSHLFILSLFILFALSSCVGAGAGAGVTPYPIGGYDPYYRGSNYDDYYERRRRREYYSERRELEKERRQLEKERERLERERERNYKEKKKAPPVYAPPKKTPVRERCPAGFSPSERKCTKKERRKGCKDLRMPGGLGCVKR